MTLSDKLRALAGAMQDAEDSMGQDDFHNMQPYIEELYRLASEAEVAH